MAVDVNGNAVQAILSEFKARHPDLTRVDLSPLNGREGYQFDLRKRVTNDSVTYVTKDLSGRNVMGILDRLYSSFTW